jgi:hypothetical protein
MNVILSEKHRYVICVQDMEDGEIGVIVGWTATHYIGSIVQRYGDSLITVAKSSGESWPEAFRYGKRWEDCRVRLLQPGDTLEIVE